MIDNYFYEFLEPMSKEFARTLKELENVIYSSPRSMLTHSRTFIEVLLEKVMLHENLPSEPYLPIIERIRVLDEQGLLSDEVKHSLHQVRKSGNMASHDARQFRFSESLTAWEHIYLIVKWFVEVYGTHDMQVPSYVDPLMNRDHTYGLEEMALRFKQIEDLLKKSLERDQLSKTRKETLKTNDADERNISDDLTSEQSNLLPKEIDEAPGFIPVRTITYGDDSIDIPYFLRDAFLLPQRFEESERFLVRLGGDQQARLMSELPNSLEGLHKRTTYYSESHSKLFFEELKQFVAEEIRRRKLIESRPGELFLFYKSKEIVVTEILGEIVINTDEFTGSPSLIKQLQEDSIYKVRDLPKELLIIGKYNGVGKHRVENFFNQLREKQKSRGDFIQ